MNLSITVKNDVVTLFGATESGAEAALAENLVPQTDGVERMINLITYNKFRSINGYESENSKQ